jgi:hypothetical protein
VPRLSRWSIRAALVYLAAGFTFGALILTAKGFPDLAWAWRLLPAHIEFLLFGWTLQLVLGVAFWILPRFSHDPRRGLEPLAWAAMAMLNLGVCLVSLRTLADLPAALTVVGRSLEAAAAIAFVAYAWPRVKPTGA